MFLVGLGTECMSNPCGSPMQGTCQEMNPGYYCQCNPPYSGTNCQSIDKLQIVLDRNSSNSEQVCFQWEWGLNACQIHVDHQYKERACKRIQGTTVNATVSTTESIVKVREVARTNKQNQMHKRATVN